MQKTSIRVQVAEKEALTPVLPSSDVVISFVVPNQPLLFGGILLMIFGVQIVLAGFQSQMIRHYAFERSDEYSVRQELD